MCRLLVVQSGQHATIEVDGTRGPGTEGGPGLCGRNRRRVTALSGSSHHDQSTAKKGHLEIRCEKCYAHSWRGTTVCMMPLHLKKA